MKPKEERRELRRLYDLIPNADIACISGCSQCCGPINVTREELKRAPLLKDSNNQLEYFVDQHQLNWCATCPYVVENGGGCAIYDNRPFLCRLYGVTEEPMLRCPHGPRSTNPLSKKESDRLMSQYLRLFKGNEQATQALLAAKILWNQKMEHEEDERARGFGLEPET